MEQINFSKFEVNEDRREITFSCASDTPYTRYDEQRKIAYDEILIIEEGSVDLTRLKNGAPLLFNHDANRLLGMVQDAYLIENRVYVRVRFSANDEFAERIYRDILDGVIKNVSIGYQVEDYEDRREDGINKRFVTRWMIYETSIVSIPADQTVGIRQQTIKETRQMENENSSPAPEQQTVQAGTEEIKETLQEQGEKALENEDKITALTAENEALKAENETLKRLCGEKPLEKEGKTLENEAEIEKLGADFNVPEEEIKSALENKLSTKEFKNIIKTKTFNINIKEQKNMETLRNYISAGDFSKPYAVRDFTGFAPSQLVGTEKLPLSKILSKKMGVKGFRTITGLNSNVTIPVQTGRNTIYAPGINQASTDSNPTFTSKTLSPVKFVGSTTIGMEMLVNSSDDVEAFIIDSITTEIAGKIEQYLLSKIAAGAENTVTFSSFDAITWQNILDMEGYLGSYNLDSINFVMSSPARAALKGIAKAGNHAAKFICEDNEINGYPVNVSGYADNNIYLGDFSKLIYAEWGGGLSVVVDVFSQARSGACVIVGSVCCDAVVEQGAAFVVGKLQDSSSSSAE